MNDEENGRLSETFLGLNKFQFTLACVILCIVAVFVSLGTFAYSVSANSARIAEGAERDAAIEQVAKTAAASSAQVNKLAESNQALNCAEAEALQKDIVQTADILIKNPGPLVFGIPRDLIEKGLQEDRAKRDLYNKYIDCSKP